EPKFYLQQYVQLIIQNQYLDLIPNAIVRFGEIIQELPECENLEKLVKQSLELYKAENKPIELARNYGFLAEVALKQERWEEARKLAQNALDTLAAIPNLESLNLGSVLSEIPAKAIVTNDSGFYRFLQARSQNGLKQHKEAIQNLEAAIKVSNPQVNLRIYIKILRFLRKLYFEQKEYIKAYDIKQQQRSVEQQFGIRAFIGAGRLQAAKQVNFALTQVESRENVAPEIAASGRLLDVQNLIERIGRHDSKLIVIHGESGVGKSSLVNAGLIPALKKKAIGTQDNLVVAIRVYTNWLEELEKRLVEALGEKNLVTDDSSVGNIDNSSTTEDIATVILERLQKCESYNLRPILIFDQFEEFFFVNDDLVNYQHFFEFLNECLRILPLKLILSLRIDYLHYLLKLNRIRNREGIHIDVLSKNVLYEVGNFSLTDAKKIIKQLTERANFDLEPALVDKLVKDLAGDFGEVRPIELQVVGAQLQTEKITTLEKYRECGTQEELIKRYLQEVVDDCGEENQKVAELVLYLLTDEKNTRPLKTRAELERDLKQLAADDSNKLDLVLQIFVKSGLVLLLPENPADRYQLVHDYLAAFIRRQQEPKLTQLMAELEKEKQQRKLSEQKLNRFLKSALVGSVAAGLVLAVLAVTAWDAARRAEKQRKQAEISEIKALTNSSEASSISGQTLNALGDGLKAAASLKKAAWATSDIQMRTMATLHEAVYIEPQEYPAIEVNTLEGHSSWVMSVVFSPDGKHIASGSSDNTIKLWDVNSGKELKTLKGHSSWVMSVVFSPDGKH
ncbi:MAG: AAA family ATPase, partial [Scytonema sp. PMC 1069.18]|nr:AAA family ATPase [Scytonema sp. PMC 1069.18]